MPKATNSTWRDWCLSVFGEPYMVWHDGPDFSLLTAAHNRDAEQVDRMLVAGVDERDPLAAESIGRLEPELPVPLASAALHAAEVEPSGEFALRRAEALFKLTADSAHREAMIAILVGKDHWGVRINAAIALGQLEPTSEAVSALEQAAADTEYLVRYHSANALLRYAGEEAAIDKHPLFEMIIAMEHEAWIAVADRLAAGAREELLGLA